MWTIYTTTLVLETCRSPSRTIETQRLLQQRGELDSTNPRRWKLCRNRNDTQSSEWCSRALLLCADPQHSSRNVKNYVSVRAALALGHGMYTCACHYIRSRNTTSKIPKSDCGYVWFILATHHLLTNPQNRVEIAGATAIEREIRLCGLSFYH